MLGSRLVRLALAALVGFALIPVGAHGDTPLPRERFSCTATGSFTVNQGSVRMAGKGICVDEHGRTWNLSLDGGGSGDADRCSFTFEEGPQPFNEGLDMDATVTTTLKRPGNLLATKVQRRFWRGGAGSYPGDPVVGKIKGLLPLGPGSFRVDVSPADACGSAPGGASFTFWIWVSGSLS